MGNVKDITGMKFGRWTVIREAGRNSYGGAMFECLCDCGEKRIVDGRSIRSGASRSCGCLAKEIRTAASVKKTRKHGGRNERLYGVWRGIIDRCENPNSSHYMQYGGRGISVCPEWRRDYNAFRTWAYANGYDDTAKKYDCTIDRIDNDSDYSPNNCIWRGMKAQCNNRSSNHILTYKGDSHTITEWSDITGIRKDTLRRRVVVYGWTVEAALTTPVKKYTRKA